MYGRIRALFLVLFGSMLFCAALVSAQTRTQAAPATLPADLTRRFDPETVKARKASVQAQIKALADSPLPKEEVEASRANLEQLVTMLTALEEALQQGATYLSQLETLPQRLQELATERQALDGRQPQEFPQATEPLRENYEAQLQTLRSDIQDIHKQTAAGEVRLAAIPRELEQHVRDRQQLEKDLLALRSTSSTAGDHIPAVEVDTLEVKLQLARTREDTLKAEREWLSKYGPLQDARLANAQTRLKLVQQDLEAIKAELSKTIQREQSSLSEVAATIEEKLEQGTDPVETLRLTFGLETVEIQQNTADYRQQLNQLGDVVLGQEKANAQLKQEVNRLTSLVEKYSSGEGIAQRLVVVFERLRRKRTRFSEGATKKLESQLRILTTQMFALDDRLYDFPQVAETRLFRFSETLAALPAAQRDGSLVKVRQALDEQRVALREQQQVLTALVQDYTKLLALEREHKQLLEESYLFVLTKMFWLRDATMLNFGVVRESFAGVVTTTKRFQALVTAGRSYLSARLSGAVYLWFVEIVIFLGLPWLVHRRRTRLLQAADTYLARAAAQEKPPGLGIGVLLIVQAALWPGYIVLLAWLLGQALPQTAVQTDLTPALVRGLQMGALILGLGLFARSVLQPEGWGQRFWELPPSLCRFLRRIAVWGCVTALVLMVPSYILQLASGDGDPAGAALARVLSLAFQTIVLVLVGILGWYRSPLMVVMLARSAQRAGLLKRIWPLLYVLLLGCVLALMTLDALGYRYAARFIWFRLLSSLSVLFIVRLIVVVLVQRLLHRLGRRVDAAPQAAGSAPILDGTLRIVQVGLHGLLMVIALATILEVWGVSVVWLLTSPTGTDTLRRALVIAVAVGMTFAILYLSSAFTEYLLRPRTTTQGVVQDPSRKLKTLAPLIQTLIKVGVVFAAVLITLEQIGVSTGPILTGVGIFGLAVGFASQSLIKDVINGMFMLFEDSLSVGDAVTLRGVGGLVEKVTLRSVTIRDLGGNVHVIPNSTIDMITNMTKEYSRYLLDVGVAYREDVDTVIAILREVDESMRRDITFGKDILEPLEVMGLDRFEDSAVIIRSRIKTRPLTQWRIGREFNKRMKKIFDERGIEIPFPHRTVYWGQPKDGKSTPLRLAMENHQPVVPREDDY